MKGFIPNVRFTLVSRKEGLKSLERNLPRELKTGLNAAGKRLLRVSRLLMKKDTGGSRQSLKVVVKGSHMSLNLRVVSSMIQAYTDAYGMPKGRWPNFRVGSNLYHWVRRRMKRGWEPADRDKSKVPRVKRPFRVSKPLSQHRFRVRNPKPVKMGPKGSDAFKEVNRIRRKTFYVARSIYRHGLAASHWNRKALEREKGNIRNDIRNAVRRAINKS